MAMNGLKKLAQVLKTESNEIFVDAETGRRAVSSIQRLMDFTSGNKIALASDA